MLERKLFLRWMVIMALTVAGLVIMSFLGWMSLIYHGDVSKLCVVILLLFIWGSSWAGRLAWTLSGSMTDPKGRLRPAHIRTAIIRKAERDLDRVHRAMTRAPWLGLLGTVLGLIITFMAMEGVNVSDAAATKVAFDKVISGISTVFMTTGAGLVAAYLLDHQEELISREIERYRPGDSAGSLKGSDHETS